MSKMNLEKSLNGFYTVTFLNKYNLEEKEILKQFTTVGNVCKIVKNNNRVFVRFKDKEEAKRAIFTFGKSHNVEMALNKKNSDIQYQSETSSLRAQSNRIHLKVNSKPKMDTLSSGFHLILGNLPKNYTIKDVNDLVGEAKPLCINEFEETRAFHVKFCHIVLDSLETLSYLINKLDGFVICGEKLIAVEAKRLLEWRELGV